MSVIVVTARTLEIRILLFKNMVQGSYPEAAGIERLLVIYTLIQDRMPKLEKVDIHIEGRGD